MARDAPKNADIAACPAQRVRRRRVIGGFTGNGKSAACDAAENASTNTVTRWNFFMTSRPLFESSGRLAIFAVCVASSDRMKAISFVTEPQSCSRLTHYIFNPSRDRRMCTLFPQRKWRLRRVSKRLARQQLASDMNVVEPILFQARNGSPAPAICAPETSLGTISYGRLARHSYPFDRTALGCKGWRCREVSSSSCKTSP